MNQHNKIVCVFGGRDLAFKQDKTYCEETLSLCFKRIYATCHVLMLTPDDLLFIDGEATGADTVGFLFASRHNLPFKRFPAQWRVNGVYNPKAGFERNSEMLECGTHFIGFWDGVSRGTNDMRKKVIKSGKALRMYKYDKNLLPNITRMREWEV